jgi:hypothetical protein
MEAIVERENLRKALAPNVRFGSMLSKKGVECRAER